MARRMERPSHLLQRVRRSRKALSAAKLRVTRGPVRTSGQLLGTDSGTLASADEAGLHWDVETFSHFRGRVYISGWAYLSDTAITRLAYRLPGAAPVAVPGWPQPSPDLEEQSGPDAARCRFSFEFVEPDPHRARHVELLLFTAAGDGIRVSDLSWNGLSRDPYHRLIGEFFTRAVTSDSLTILEVGSRNRSGVIRRGLVGTGNDYVGLDVVAGENVDVVGDVHEAGSLFPPSHFDMIFSTSTFEHLAMPWKAAVELNRIMKPGGLMLVTSHHTWPLHEEPWDFWRFSDSSWRALFNRFTGYEILDAAMGEAASVVADLLHDPVAGLSDNRAYLGSAVLCQKVAEATVRWDVPLNAIVTVDYPQ